MRFDGRDKIPFFSLISSTLSFIFLTLFRVYMSNIDYFINSWASSIYSPTLTMIAIFISITFDVNSLIFLTILFCIFLCIKHRIFIGSIVFVGSILGNAITVYLIKEFIRSPRPLNMVINEVGFSFPSGHASSITVFTMISSYILFKKDIIHNKLPLISLYAFLVFIVCFNRIYLNVHWFSDVLGGFILGVAWTSLAIMILQHKIFKC
ncbi:MAG: phosphatase PAP2 family protein [Candidatus Methanomethylicia archaeon]